MIVQKPVKYTYTFIQVNSCNMCGASGLSQKKMGRRMNCSNGLYARNKTGISTTVMKCRKCGLIYSNPMPIPQSISQHYNLSFSEYYPEDFLEHADEGLIYPKELKFIDIFLEHHTGSLKPRILDIGAGVGITLKKYQTAGFDIHGLEPNEQFCNESRHFLGDDSLKMNCTPFEGAEYPDGYFDFIISFNVLEHVYDPDELIRTALKWLKPGGLFGIVVPYSEWFTAKLMNAFYRMQLSDCVTNISPMHDPFHLYEFGKKSFALNAVKNGYSVFRQNIVNTSSHLPKLLDLVVNPIMNLCKMGLRLEIIIQKELQTVRAVKGGEENQQ